MTDAEFLHRQKEDPDPELLGKVKVSRNMAAFIGGFGRYPNRTQDQEQAAARFLSLYQRSQIGGAKASDMSQPFVDGSGPREESVLVAGEDARRAYAAAKTYLGDGRTLLLERVIAARTIAGERLRLVPPRCLAAPWHQWRKR